MEKSMDYPSDDLDCKTAKLLNLLFNDRTQLAETDLIGPSDLVPQG